ncbi:MBL fold metallo-hydrolase [Nocardia tengchongensis]|uniref:MBL fold metallo-hydrolase n=1 Tax=Nocardia tengchongensis TaxID=2055889 RepID=UPI0036817BA4
MVTVIPLDAATFRPLGGRLWDGASPLWSAATMVCTCLAIVHDHGVALVDTGPGSAAADDGGASLGKLWAMLFRPDLRQENTLLAQLHRHGIEVGDVTDVILSHGDIDHSGGLSDFPNSRVHLHREELLAIKRPLTLGEQKRYRPELFAHEPRWCTYGGDDPAVDWFGFQAYRAQGLPPQVLLVKLAGHSRGMLGVAIDIGGHWILHAADAYFHASEIDPRHPRRPMAVRAFGFATRTLALAYPDQQARLRTLVRDHGDQVTVVSSHCAQDLRLLQSLTAPEQAHTPQF